MKKLFLILVIGLLFGFTTQAKPANPPAGFGIFFSALNPHGTWIELDYGMVVWRPTIMARNWAPYRTGQWVWTNDGWYWDSYEPFGYVTYHYGRWYYDDYYGWLWVPDYEWAPAWVEWRYDDVYIGWAPLNPYAAFTINVGIHYTYDYYTPYAHWHFVNYNHFCDPYVYNHFVGSKYKHSIYERTKYRTNYDYYDGRVVNRGVDIDYVRQRSGNNIRTRDIERVRDYTQFENNRDRKDGNDRLRTLYVPKDELERNRDNFDRNNLTRSDRKTTLNISRIELGERRDVKREDRNTERITKENKDVRTDKNITTDRGVKRVDRTDINMNRNPVVDERNTDLRKNEERNIDRGRNDVQVNNRGNKKVEEEKKRLIDNTKRIQKEVSTNKGNNNERILKKNTDLRTNRNENRKLEVTRPETRTEQKNKVEKNDKTDRNDRTKQR